MHNVADSNTAKETDSILVDIADYVHADTAFGELAMTTAKQCLADTLGCGFLALRYPECTKHLGPIVQGTLVPHGARVPGTQHELDPIKAAFDLGCMVRWLDYNDTWLAAEWGHPSDNLGGILMVADWVSRNRRAAGEAPLTMHEVLRGMIQAHEIQGVLALTNSFNRVGIDHVALVKIASTAVVAKLLGADRDQTVAALSHAFLDGQSLRTYRHAPNTGSRKSWAAGDATSRAVRLALIALKGEMGYATPISTPTWGVNDVLMRGSKPITLERKLESYVMENVLFKIRFPAEFHAQTAVEAAIALHPQLVGRVDDIERIEITTHESAIRIISKVGALHNPADRDHCLQYMIAIGLLHGNLQADHYEEDVASDPRIDALRDKMVVSEDKRYSKEYLDLDKRSIANRIQLFFKDGSSSDAVEVEYPIGHRVRREEGIPVLRSKAETNFATRYPAARASQLVASILDEEIEDTAVDQFVDSLVI